MPQPRSAPSSGAERGPAAPLLRAERLSKAYRNGVGETRVLWGASIELPRGETTSLVGASGSGTSTLIAVLAGLMVPQSGRVVFDGLQINDLDDTARAR